MQIIAKGLRYSYDPKSKFNKEALTDVTLEISTGDFFGIIGQTGSGKSTFIQHLNGILPVQKNSGYLTVGEFDLTAKKPNYKQLRKHVGMVFQYPEYQLFAETVADDVAFALKNFYPEYNEEETAVRVKEAIETVGLNYYEVKSVSPFELSGGQKRRVAIAGTIVYKPEILVLDEPVAGLDPEGKADLTKLLHLLLEKEIVKTVVIVSHDMDFVAENCNKVAVFSHGKTVKTGTPEEVFTSPEEMASLGLELPLTASILYTLKRKGISIESGLTAEEFSDNVIKGVKA